MNQEELSQFEKYCQIYFSTHSPEQRNQADQKLASFRKKEFVPKLNFALKHSNSEYGLIFASTSLEFVVKTFWNSFNPSQKTKLRNQLLDVLLSRGSSLKNNVIRKIIWVVSVCCKFGWLDDPTNRTLPSQIDKCFLSGAFDPAKARVGIEIYWGLVEVMTANKIKQYQTIRQHRKISSSFRDIALRNIFESTIVCLKKLKRNYQQQGPSSMLLHSCCDLVLSCLAFDFIGICPSEGMGETVVIPLPESWRPLFEEGDCVGLFWNQYLQLNKPNEKLKVMEILVLLACVRRAIFSDDFERSAYVEKFMNGIYQVIQTRNGLNDPKTFHTFCRLLARMKGNFNVIDFVKCGMYPKWIESVATFSIHVFKQWNFSKSSCFYILDFWRMFLKYENAAKFVLGGRRSMTPRLRRILGKPKITPRKTPSKNANAMLRGMQVSEKKVNPTIHPTNLKKYAPRVASEYIVSRMAYASGVEQSEGVMENPINTPVFIQELGVISFLVHSDYKQTRKTLIGLFNNIYGKYKQILTTPTEGKRLFEVEGQLAWLIYIFGSVIGHKSGSPQENLDVQEIDAQLSVRVLTMSAIINQRLQKYPSSKSGGRPPNQQQMNQGRSGAALPPGGEVLNSIERLELSVLSFLTSFRRHYLNDPRANEKLFMVMSSTIPVCKSPGGVLKLFVDKISKNLRFWGHSTSIIRKTLDLFQILCTSVTTGKVVADLPNIKYILEHHGPEHFSFLRVSKNLSTRVTFYQILTRSFFLRFNTEKDFLNFVRPLENSLNLMNDPKTQFNEVLHNGIFRDLRGVCSACKQPAHYQHFFNFIYPRYYPNVILQAIKASQNWSGGPGMIKSASRCLISALKFVREFVTNQHNRIMFGYNSPSGILLFKESAKIVITAAQYLRNLKIPPNADSNSKYAVKYKSVSLVLDILHRCLCGKYCNFGVFQLYNDKVLIESLALSVDAVLSIPKNDILQHKKVGISYFNLVDLLFNPDFIELVIQFETSVFLNLLQSISAGLASTDLNISSKNCNAMDGLCTFMFHQMVRTNEKKRQSKSLPALQNHLSKSNNLFKNVLRRLFHVILYEECGNQWSISRVMLSLICIEKDFFVNVVQKKMVQQVTGEGRQKKMVEEWKKLMKGVGLSLEEGNREKFTDNLVSFRANCRMFL